MRDRTFFALSSQPFECISSRLVCTATMSDQHDASTRSSNISLNECIQASLRTLELVKHSQRDDVLSEYEIESTHVSLNQLIRTAESIKEKITSRESNECDTSQQTNPNTAELQPADTTPNSVTSQHSSSETRTAADQPLSEAMTRTRKLSKPCLMPIESLDIAVRFFIVL